MIEPRSLLRLAGKERFTRLAVKALIPNRYHATIRGWLVPHPQATPVQWCRVVMNQEVERFIRSLDCSSLDTLEISGTGSQDKYNFRTYKTAAYPEYDVCRAPLALEQFDLIIAEQVFEHVLRPDRAAFNVYRMLRPGGFFVINTPFLLKVHEHPLDLYRWTEHGIRQLLEAAGFNVLSTGSWGNRECLFADMKPGLDWTPYNPRKHDLHNEPQFAIVVWAFAHKQKSE